MRTLTHFLACAAFAITFASCEKEELPVEPFERGDAEVVQLEMGVDYDKQFWFDLGDGETVREGDKHLWDIAVEYTDSTSIIHLNSAVAMTAASTGQFDFGAMEVYGAEDEFSFLRRMDKFG